MPDVRLIDGNALVKEIESVHCKDCDSYNGAMCRACEWMDAMDYIEDAPKVDAQPVKHGKWVDYGSGVGMYCSECRHRIRYRNGIRKTAMFSDGEFKFVQYASKNGYYDFCPKCGAKMDGDTDEQ